MIKINKLTKSYDIGNDTYQVLKGIDLTIKKGEFVSIMGPSGSGKSTLLNILGGLDKPDSGTVEIDSENIALLNEHQQTLFRRKNIGFIFQNYQLMPSMTVEENIAFPMHSASLPKSAIKQTVSELITATQLQGKEKNFPAQLSGGQQQRVSISRALTMNPKLVLADEPTGNLDRKMGTEVLRLLSSLHQNQNLTIVMVTHDIYAASYSDRIILLKDGMIELDINQTEGGDIDVIANILTKLNP